jgi:hypothetical protein
MTDRNSTVRFGCPKCNASIVVEQNWTAGGVNDCGGYAVQCTACRHIFHFRLGRDVNDSRVFKGATILAIYDEAVDGDKDRVLAQFGLTA